MAEPVSFYSRAEDFLSMPSHLKSYNPVTILHCLLSKASRLLDNFSDGPSVKSFDYLVPGVVTQYLNCFLTSHSLILSLPALGEIGIIDSGPRDGLLDPF
jgi:hypothetical protein